MSENGTHVALEGREVNVRNEKNRLGLKVTHHLEDGHIIAFLEDGNFDIRNWEKKGSRLTNMFTQKDISKSADLYFYGHLEVVQQAVNNKSDRI